MSVISKIKLPDGNTYDLSGLPTGGTQGQVLTKNSATNYDVSWDDPSADPYETVSLTSGNSFVNIYLSPNNETNGTIDINIIAYDDEGFFPCHLIFDIGYNDSGSGDQEDFTIYTTSVGVAYGLTNVKYGTSSVSGKDVISIEMNYVGDDSYAIVSSTIPGTRWSVASANSTTITNPSSPYNKLIVNTPPRINGGDSSSAAMYSSIYVPVSTGTAGQVLTWPNSGSTPIWSNATGGINSSNNTVSDIIAVSETAYATLVNNGTVNSNTIYIVVPDSN